MADLSIGKKIKLKPVFLVPITKNGGKIPDLLGISAIIMRNAGDSVISLENGAYTLQQYETLSFNVTEDFGTMDVLDVTVNFIGGSTNKLELIILVPSNC